MIKPQADPVLLIYFTKGTKGLTSKLGLGDFGTPIPIYLSEKLTGLYVDTEKEGLSISTDNIVEVLTKDGKKQRGEIKVQQKGETQSVEISLIGRSDSIGLNLILPLLKTIYDKVVSSAEYRIAYFHDNILIFNARLSNFSKNQSRNDNLIHLDISLEVPPEQEKEESIVSKLGFSSNSVPVGA